MKYYSFGNDIPGLHSATSAARSHYASVTVLTMPVTTQSTYDVALGDAYYGDNNAFAWASCPPLATTFGFHPTQACFNQEVRFNASYMGAYTTAAERQTIACHELGHTVGLRHWNNPDDGHHAQYPFSSCMYTPSGQANRTGLSGIDANHIDDTY